MVRTANNRPQIKEEIKVFYEVELVENVPGCVIEPMEIEDVIIPEDWDI